VTLLAETMHCHLFVVSIKLGICLASFAATVSNTDYFIRQFFVKIFFIPLAPATQYYILCLKHGHLTLTASFLLSVVWV
jgi:hypothetical protein